MAAIHYALTSWDSPEAKQLAVNSLAQALGTSAAGIAAGVGKGKPNPQSENKSEITLKSKKIGKAPRIRLWIL